MSPSTPPVFVTGTHSKKPAKNLVIIIVWMSFAVAVPKEKTAARKYGIKTAGLRPKISVNGAQNKGANPNPQCRTLNLRSKISVPTWNYSGI